MNNDNDSAPRSAWEREITGRVDSLEARARHMRWLAGIAIPALLAAFAWSWTAVQGASERAGEVRAEIAALHRVIDLLDQHLDADIRELRSKILKLSGVDDPSAVVIAVTP